jgi:cellulose synthase/poly-beta-1,6-N-acetylglucosamine synthase-like glycosyltransferase
MTGLVLVTETSVDWSYYPHTMHTATQQISVILPAYNEEISIGSMVHLTRLYADKIIVVDDGSSDRQLRLRGKQKPR